MSTALTILDVGVEPFGIAQLPFGRRRFAIGGGRLVVSQSHNQQNAECEPVLRTTTKSIDNCRDPRKQPASRSSASNNAGAATAACSSM